MDTVITKNLYPRSDQKKHRDSCPGKRFSRKIYVDEGQHVQAGQVLFRIMPQIYQADVLKAKAEVAQAEIELQNASTLANNNVVSINEKKMAKAKLDAAKAELNLAQTHLSFTTIKAPFSGIIDRLPLN
jgi:membrane fusion protein (multidrug efflux system)